MDLQFNEPLMYKIYTKKRQWAKERHLFMAQSKKRNNNNGSNREKSHNKIHNFIANSFIISQQKYCSIFVVIREIFLWSIFESWVSLIAKEIL